MARLAEGYEQQCASEARWYPGAPDLGVKVPCTQGPFDVGAQKGLQ